jgi:hypothetical protein
MKYATTATTATTTTTMQFSNMEENQEGMQQSNIRWAMERKHHPTPEHETSKRNNSKLTEKSKWNA